MASSEQQDYSSGYPSLSVTLKIQPNALEQRYWTRRSRSRLLSLDNMFELCNAVMWLAILPSLAGPERLICKTRLMIAAAQLAVMHITPQLWLQHRSIFLTASQVLHYSLQVPWQHFVMNSPLSAQAESPGMPVSTLMLLASGFWSHLLFVLFHQQQFTIQATLLALSSLIQGVYVISSPLRQSGLEGISRNLRWAFDQLIGGFFGNVLPNSEAMHYTNSEDTTVLTAALFLHLFGSLLLPCFLAYIMEWKLKVSFLLCECSTQNEQLRVLTPTAAIVRSSVLLSALLYAGWLLLMAVVSWVICSTAATFLVGRLMAS